MGQSPEIPDYLSDEGKDFLGTCFVHLPEERATAQDLLSHSFTKVQILIKIDRKQMFLEFQIFEEDDNASLPLFASVSDFVESRRSLVKKNSGKY